jgi:thymidylate kinase
MNFIFEGIDNVGKTTQIKMLLGELAKTALVHTIHYQAIPGMKPKKAKEYSLKLYMDMFSILIDRIPNYRYYILDRSHIGEFVYGHIYRKYDPSYIFAIEDRFSMLPMWQQTYLITLLDHPEAVLSRDDGLSFTTEVKKKQEEIDRFIEATDRSSIPHKITIFNEERSITDIHMIIKNFLIDAGGIKV